MPAPKGNTNAEKWTRAIVLKEVEAILVEAKKPSCLWIGSAMAKRELYRDIWAYWKEKFKDDKVVFRTIKRVDQIFENRLFEKAAKGDVNTTIAIFGLKNNHNWRDKTEQDINVVSPIVMKDDIK